MEFFATIPARTFKATAPDREDHSNNARNLPDAFPAPLLLSTTIKNQISRHPTPGTGSSDVPFPGIKKLLVGRSRFGIFFDVREVPA